jgi:predicted outer membrane repeat protein
MLRNKALLLILFARKHEIFPSDIVKPSLVLFATCCAFCFFILSVFISPSVVFAATIFVGPGDTIQEAINAASKTGDTVSVAASTYYENIIFPPGKTITLVSENGAASTVIDGGNSGTVVTFATENESTLDGFTIQNGSTSANGGGVLIGSFSTPTITNCIITGNQAFAGGGISCGESSAPWITNSIIQNNSVTGDTDLSNGGGIHISPSASPTITNCIIHNNTSGRNGGGLAFYNAEPTIVNCTFSNNTAAGTGGAIACTNPLQGTAVANSILWGDNPGEISCDSEISVTYSDIQDGYAGEGNINADPMFVDQANGDFHLQEDSPCIDAGDNSAPALPATDIDGDARKMDDPAVDDTGNGTPPIVDMGADEYLSSPTVPLSSSTIMPLMLFFLSD